MQAMLTCFLRQAGGAVGTAVNLFSGRLRNPARQSDGASRVELHHARAPCQVWNLIAESSTEQCSSQVDLRQGAQSNIGSRRSRIDLDHCVSTAVLARAEDDTDSEIAA